MVGVIQARLICVVSARIFAPGSTTNDSGISDLGLLVPSAVPDGEVKCYWTS